MMTRFKLGTSIALAVVLGMFSTSKADAAILSGTVQFALQNVSLSGGACGVDDFYTNCTTINSTGGITTQTTGTGDFTDVVQNTALVSGTFVYNPPTGNVVTPFLSFTDPDQGQVDFFVTDFTLAFNTIFPNGILVLSVDGHGYFSNGGDLTLGQFSFASTRTDSNPTGVSYQGGGTLEALGIPRDTTVPEPTSMVLLGTGLIGLGARLRRRAKKA